MSETLQERAQVLFRQPDEFLEKIKDLPIEEQIKRAEARERALGNPAFTSEIGKNGGAHPEATKKSRITKRLAEWADEEEQVELIKGVFERAMKEEVAEYVQIQAAEKILANRRHEHEMELRQRERDEDRLDRGRAIDLLEQKLTKMIEQGDFSPEILEAFEEGLVVAVEDEPRQIEAASDSDET